MSSSLLTTKVQIPPRQQQVLARPRLLEQLERDVVRHPLTLVAAPAGYGKTTLLAGWARQSERPVAWLSIDPEENDPDRFLRYLLAAWAQVQPQIRERPPGLLLSAPGPDRQAVLTAFVNEAGDLPNHLVFVLDDYHLIEDPAVHDALTFLLDHGPPRLHFVLAGRGEPPLRLARYRARRQLLELGVDDLRFSPGEAAGFFRRVMGLELSAQDAARLCGDSEGWIAGMQLAALTWRRPGDRLPEGQAVSGRQRFIVDYLAQEVLAQRPAEERRFLLSTAIAERISGPLADAITGEDGGQATLEWLERENLFLLPLDDRRRWFRYHPLFAEFLRGELERAAEMAAAPPAELHRRAARWFAEQDLAEDAVRHAVAGGEVALVSELFERFIYVKLMSGEIRVVQQWLDSLPEEWLSGYTMIGIAQAGLCMVTGQFEACARRLDEIQQYALEGNGAPEGAAHEGPLLDSALLDSEESRRDLARVNALRCAVACFQNDLEWAEALAEQALRDLPEDDMTFRPGIYGALGDTYQRNGRWEDANQSYRKMLEFGDTLAVRVHSAHVYGALADLALRKGRLHEAAGHWEQALAATQERENWGRVPLPVSGWVRIRMAELLYERNDFDAAWEHLSGGLERAELGGDVRALIAGYLIAGRLKLTEGDVEAADAYLEKARPLVQEAGFPEWTARFRRFQLELWLAQDRLRAAVDWADEVLEEGVLEQQPENAGVWLAMARALIVKGDPPALQEALAMLERVREVAEAQERGGVMVEALALQALAHRRRGDDARALTSLEQALRRAEPEGYLRLFADLGPPMARLLQEAHSRQVMPEYVAELLEAFDTGAPLAAQAGLPEPLTPRELEVLELMAAGLTNPEIGEALVISPETVKKHASNIYGKLGAANRTEAATIAREMGLLA